MQRIQQSAFAKKRARDPDRRQVGRGGAPSAHLTRYGPAEARRTAMPSLGVRGLQSLSGHRTRRARDRRRERVDRPICTCRDHEDTNMLGASLHDAHKSASHAVSGSFMPPPHRARVGGHARAVSSCPSPHGRPVSSTWPFRRFIIIRTRCEVRRLWRPSMRDPPSPAFMRVACFTSLYSCCLLFLF